MNFPEIVDIVLPAEGVFHNLVFVSIKKPYPMQVAFVDALALMVVTPIPIALKVALPRIGELG